uniref:ST8 alpha-N-acetyl-neuraminide alpha-2,8-sialyltransferase 6 n=2 Tax=Denticeps clupeoides TaxID=299321 RepID=A0AAY4C2S0_9TELE
MKLNMSLLSKAKINTCHCLSFRYMTSKSPSQDQKSSVIDSTDACPRDIISSVVQRYSVHWRKQEINYKYFRTLLKSSCSGYSVAVITQANTPLGSMILYDGEKRKPLTVTPAIFHTFAKDLPIGNVIETCAVVGNGGILANSSCGHKIDSAKFVFRCNLPPMNGFEKDVGNRTDLVTVNPSILLEKFAGLMEHRWPFVESLHPYGNSLMLIPAFSYGLNTPVSLRAVYTLEDFQSPVHPIFLNPKYLSNLAGFWHARGLHPVRLSSGFILASLALEVCIDVQLYGFWPFSQHPDGRQAVNNHYYDNRESKKKVHTMPVEFDHLLQLHEQGILRLHLGDCLPNDRQTASSTQTTSRAQTNRCGHAGATTTQTPTNS